MNDCDTRHSRRRFLAQAGAAVLAATSSKHLSAAPPKRTLRVIAYNIYQCTGWPKDRALAKQAVARGQMPERFANELALYEPDIIVFSESPDAEVVERIAERLGMNSVRFPSGHAWPGTLLSRFEITGAKTAPVLSGNRPKDLFTRHWGQATVHVPDVAPLIVHSAHLHPSKQDVRVREIEAMLASMADDMEANRSMLLMGDLNHTPTSPESPMWTSAGWTDTFAEVGRGDGLTIKADKPKRRIDYVMAAGPIAKHVVESRPLFEGAFRLNADDPQAFSLSDHLPQLAVFEI